MAKKSFNVEQFRKEINECLAGSTCNADVRQGLINALESVLHKTGNYHGFRYLEQREVPEKELPGIYPERDPEPVDLRFANTDRTRVTYY